VFKTNTNRVFSDVAVATYFGLKVVVLCQMENYSLISCGGRELIVDTSDLVFERLASKAA
jgi:hypothetical protein